MVFRAAERLHDRLEKVVDSYETGSIPHKVCWPLYLRVGNFLYFQHVDNRHALPYVGDLICRIGRHDYEFDGLTDTGYGKLYCMRCGHVKRSYPISRGEG